MEILKAISPSGHPVPVDYAIYPSLLDAYLRFKRHDDDETFNSLFDKINKVKTEQTEQQLRGVAFELCVNAEIDGELPFGVEYHQIGDFQFKESMINKIARKLQRAAKRQEYLECIIHTHRGNVKLYGIADYTFPEMITDLKGTENYKCNKYKDNCQCPVYSLIRKLNGQPIKAFKYLVSDYSNVYQETYIPNDNMHKKLMLTLFDFINFIEYFRGDITNTKIFGIENQIKIA